MADGWQLGKKSPRFIYKKMLLYVLRQKQPLKQADLSQRETSRQVSASALLKEDFRLLPSVTGL